MKPVDAPRNVQSSGVLSTASFGISTDTEDLAMLVGILRDKLYSNKALAVLREYATNAYDAHVQAGMPDRPIRIGLPTDMDHQLVIRDFGPGLTEEDIYQVFLKYGRSTKRNDNVALGMFGIGAKAGFAYNDAFTITSYCGGMKKIYHAVIDESKIGRADKLWEEPSEETGIEIKVPVRPQDRYTFYSEASTLFRYWTPAPELNLDVERPELLAFEDGDFFLHPKKTVHGWVAIIGCVPYRIRTEAVQAAITDADVPGISQFISGSSGGFRIPIGGVDIAANREDFEYTDRTKKLLAEKIVYLAELVARQFETSLLEADTFWQAREVARRFQKQFGVPVPAAYRNYLNDRVKLYDSRDLWRSKQPKTTIEGEIFKALDSEESVDGVAADVATPVPAAAAKPPVPPPKLPKLFTIGQLDTPMNKAWSVVGDGMIIADPEAQLVIRDVGKSLRGYNKNGVHLNRRDCVHIVTPEPGAKIDAVEQELECFLLDAELSGIPVERLSTYQYTPVYHGAPKLAHRKNTFSLVRPATQHLKLSSDAWIPTAGLPDDAVWVVLERFKMLGHRYADTQQFVARVEILLKEAFGPAYGTLPEIFGVKTTERKPVDASTLPGKALKFWLRDHLRKLLRDPAHKILQEVRRAQLAYDIARKIYLPLEECGPLLHLDGRHAIRRLLRSHREALDAWGRISPSFREAVRSVYDLLHEVEDMCSTPTGDPQPAADATPVKAGSEPRSAYLEAVSRIYKKYPLLDPKNRGPSLSILTQSEVGSMWVDYVILIDGVKPQGME